MIMMKDKIKNVLTVIIVLFIILLFSVSLYGFLQYDSECHILGYDTGGISIYGPYCEKITRTYLDEIK